MSGLCCSFSLWVWSHPLVSPCGVCLTSVQAEAAAVVVVKVASGEVVAVVTVVAAAGSVVGAVTGAAAVAPQPLAPSLASSTDVASLGTVGIACVV